MPVRIFSRMSVPHLGAYSSPMYRLGHDLTDGQESNAARALQRRIRSLSSAA